jgi:zinc/manganese transport system substrate-binding protein
MRRSIALIATAVALVAAACSGGNTSEDRLEIVTTTTILGDVVRNVVGEAADVEVIMPTGASPHEFVASSQQVASIYGADLVVANGLNLEEGLGDVLEGAKADGVNVLEVAPFLDPVPFSAHGIAGEEGEDGSALDPHVWLDPLRMETAADAIADALGELDGGQAWHDRSDAYAAELEDANTQIEALLETVPPERRKLVTNHEALGYFADRYGFEIIGAVITGGSSMGEPSSAELSDLVAIIEREQVPAIFAETSEPQSLAEAVAAEAGADIAVVELYTESLGEPGSDADSLIGMLLVDARRMADALGT